VRDSNNSNLLEILFTIAKRWSELFESESFGTSIAATAVATETKMKDILINKNNQINVLTVPHQNEDFQNHFLANQHFSNNMNTLNNQIHINNNNNTNNIIINSGVNNGNLHHQNLNSTFYNQQMQPFSSSSTQNQASNTFNHATNQMMANNFNSQNFNLPYATIINNSVVFQQQQQNLLQQQFYNSNMNPNFLFNTNKTNFNLNKQQHVNAISLGFSAQPVNFIF
jgi:hypothetical protein